MLPPRHRSLVGKHYRLSQLIPPVLSNNETHADRRSSQPAHGQAWEKASSAIDSLRTKAPWASPSWHDAAHRKSWLPYGEVTEIFTVSPSRSPGLFARE
ncbi:hypothetical protein MN608_07688 [Microdochium nivale]|nr:hypothetical protein MN608_07688 [Microdochium nivale]